MKSRTCGIGGGLVWGIVLSLDGRHNGYSLECQFAHRRFSKALRSNNMSFYWARARTESKWLARFVSVKYEEIHP